ncbi:MULTISPECIES: hypothetical protein [unclassified Agromyces]|uniref:hypothetical protein n=1 Tax=unclassified Agromyces TaxID=2639701 RepID=UPI0030151BC6
MTRIHTAALALTAAIAFFVGGWASFAPDSFFDSFPGVLGQWVATDGPFNAHLVRDVGAMYLALGAASVAGLVWRSPSVTRLLGLAWTVFGVLHLWYHATHLDHLDTDAAIGTVVSLTLSLGLGILLLTPARDDRRRETDAAGTAGPAASARPHARTAHEEAAR